jgi:hypothetical protein
VTTIASHIGDPTALTLDRSGSLYVAIDVWCQLRLPIGDNYFSRFLTGKRSVTGSRA